MTKQQIVDSWVRTIREIRLNLDGGIELPPQVAAELAQLNGEAARMARERGMPKRGA